MSNESFIKQLLDRDPAAVRRLMHLFTGRIFSVVINHVHNREDAEEITQDVFLSCLEKLEGFKSESSLSTWLYRIAINKSLDFLKFKKRTKRSGIVIPLFKSRENEPSFVPVDYIHPGVKLENREQRDALFSSIQKLPEKQRTALILVRLDGLPQKEVSEIMNLSLKAVESLLQRAKKGLRKHLEYFYDESYPKTKE